MFRAVHLDFTHSTYALTKVFLGMKMNMFGEFSKCSWFMLLLLLLATKLATSVVHRASTDGAVKPISLAVSYGDNHKGEARLSFCYLHQFYAKGKIQEFCNLEVI